MNDKVSFESGNIARTFLIVFIVLKLTNNIDWSWWWVMSPLWLPIVAFMFILSVGFLAGASKGIKDEYTRR